MYVHRRAHPYILVNLFICICMHTHTHSLVYTLPEAVKLSVSVKINTHTWTHTCIHTHIHRPVGLYYHVSLWMRRMLGCVGEGHIFTKSQQTGRDFLSQTQTHTHRERQFDIKSLTGMQINEQHTHTSWIHIHTLWLADRCTYTPLLCDFWQSLNDEWIMSWFYRLTQWVSVRVYFRSAQMLVLKGKWSGTLQRHICT